ncbi:MAG: PAS domain-containing protein [Flavisolibacter sp.]|nr:PAS domain-containing protein [Flavisolibacter sp.]
MTMPTLTTQMAFALLDNQPESIVYYIPVWNSTGKDSIIDDFEVAYCNKEAAHLTGVSQNELLGQKTRSMVGTDEKVRTLLFDQIVQVYQSGTPVEDTYFNSVLEKYFSILRTKVEDGVLTVARDITREKQEQEEKDRQTILANSIFDTSLNGIFACEAIRDASGKIIDLEMKRINCAFTQMLGLSEEQVVGKTYLSIFPTATENGTFALNCQVIESGVSAHNEVYYKGDNLDAWYDVSLSKLGKDGLLVTFADITEQKKAFLQIEQQKTLLDNILMHSANGISVTEVYRDHNGKVIDGKTILANDAAVHFTGIPRDIYLSKRATELDPNIIESPYYQLCIKTLETGEPQFAQYYLELTQRWLEISISKLDKDHLITIFTDVTQAKEAQLHQQQLLEDLKRSNANLEEFAHAASHDLKEPVRKVYFFSEQLKSKLGHRLDAEEIRLIERIQAATDRMRLLIEDLLEYSHVSHRPQHVEEIDLNDKMKIVLMDLEVPIMEKNASISVGQLPKIKGYRRQLQQLFQNLISNALKYSKTDVEPVIQVTSQEVTGQNLNNMLPENEVNKKFHFIEVKDNGIGFDQSAAQRIFNMFQRLHGKDEYSGTGIGLAIVKKVVENHQGYIWAEGREGEGATFKLLLPAE